MQPPPWLLVFHFSLEIHEREPGVFNSPHTETMCGILGIFGSGMSETDLRSKLIECSKM